MRAKDTERRKINTADEVKGLHLVYSGVLFAILLLVFSMLLLVLVNVLPDNGGWREWAGLLGYILVVGIVVGLVGADHKRRTKAL